MSIDPSFLEAIKTGDVRKVQRLLEGDPNLGREADEQGLSPILIAAYHHKSEVAEAIASQLGLLNIFEASAIGKTTHIIRILAREPELVDAYSVDGFQPLGLAAFFGHKETADYLIGAGAPVNASSNNPLKVTPLHSAVAGNNFALAELLLKCGADPNLRQSGGFTPLHAAAQNGNVDLLRILLINGADLKVQSDDGKTALDFAREAGHTDAEQYLGMEITKRLRKR